MIPYIINGNGTISILINNKMKPIDTAHPNYKRVKQALKDKDWILAQSMVDLEELTKSKIDNADVTTDVKVEHGEIKYKGSPIHNTLTDRMLVMIEEGFDVEYLIKFLDNLMKNPSHRAVNELYSFLEVGGIPITERGTFLAYKKIRDNYTDIHSGTFDNSVGTVVSMPRYMVDDDSSKTCSTGLHVCSYDYLSHFGSGDSKVVICEVNPAHCCAIPKDYNDTKMRVCEYKVIGEVFDYETDNLLNKTSVLETAEFNEIIELHYKIQID